MSLIVELRIPMPLTSYEYALGSRYTTAKFGLDNTGGGEGVDILMDRPLNKGEASFYDGRFKSGFITRKMYRFPTRMPPFIQGYFGPDILDIYEESWNCHPYTKTELTNPYMKVPIAKRLPFVNTVYTFHSHIFQERFFVIIDTIHRENDVGRHKNALYVCNEVLER